MGLFFRPVARRPSIFWRSLAKVGAKMVKITSKMRQDGAKMGVSGAIFDVLARSWEIWGVLGSILEVFWEMGESVKSNNATAFWLDFGGPGVCLGASWGLSCAILAISWAMLGNLGAMLGHFGQHVGAKMPKMSQDGRTWEENGWL